MNNESDILFPRGGAIYEKRTRNVISYKKAYLDLLIEKRELEEQLQTAKTLLMKWTAAKSKQKASTLNLCELKR